MSALQGHPAALRGRDKPLQGPLETSLLLKYTVQAWQKEFFMGIARTEIVLKNNLDVGQAKLGNIREKDIRQTQVLALADTGCGTMVITEEVQKKLGLGVSGLRKSNLADGKDRIYKVTEAVEVHWQDRDCVCKPLIVPGAKECLLGAIPMEDLDLCVKPGKFSVEPAHEADMHTVYCVGLMLDGPVVEYPASTP
jgi:clan AA aspartic protease